MAQRYANEAEARQAKAQKAAIEKEMKMFTELKRLSKMREFDSFAELIIDVIVNKSIALFAGEGPKDWSEFQATRAEVKSYMYILQQIGQAGVIEEQYKKQLEMYKEVD